ncbi:glycosyltransferase [bacterium]|nr:glycosyltransferase [bacterium]
MKSSRDERQPLASVIVPAFNAAATIAETIESVQAQTYTNWEMVITDDGSSDETPAIVREFAAADDRIRLLQFEENTGLAARARNNSMQHARGEFFAFLDADDVWVPEKLEKQIAYLLDHPDIDAITCWYYVFGDAERVRQYNNMMWRFSSESVTVDQVLQQSLNTDTIVMRRHCFEQLGGMIESSSLRFGEDYEYFIRLVVGFHVARLTEELCGYRLAPQGESLSTSEGQLDQRRSMELTMLDYLREGGVLNPRQLQRRAAIVHYNLAKDNLFTYHLPFRGDLWKSVRTLRAPAKANVMFLLSFLPASLLRRALIALLTIKNRF